MCVKNRLHGAGAQNGDRDVGVIELQLVIEILGWMVSSQKNECYKKRGDLGDTLRICHNQRKMVLCPNPGFLRSKVPK